MSFLALELLERGHTDFSIASGPLSEAVLKGRPWTGAQAAYGSGYGGLIVLTGVSAAVGGVSFLGKRMGWV